LFSFKFGKYLWRKLCNSEMWNSITLLIEVESEISFVARKSLRHMNMSVHPHSKPFDHDESLCWNAWCLLFRIKMLVPFPWRERFSSFTRYSPIWSEKHQFLITKMADISGLVS
jgi:hypothetical protein